jgi:hypothetical protein
VGTAIDQGYHRAVREQKTVVLGGYVPAFDLWLELHAYPSKDGGLSVYGRNITERKQPSSAWWRRGSWSAAGSHVLCTTEPGVGTTVRLEATLTDGTLGHV